MTEALIVRGASKRFGSTQALDGADLTLERGELLLLLGPNGAGKTTMVRAVAGRVRLDAGEIVLFGQVVGPGGKGVRARLGFVPQEVGLYWLLTPRENLEVFGKLNGLGRGTLRTRVGWALEWTGLEERARDPLVRLSGGMRRRLNIACGVLHEPELVLLDEPTVGIDPQSRERIWEMLDGLRQAGTSLVLTTHQLEEAQSRCDRVAVLDRGRTIATGTPTELVASTVGTRRIVKVILDRPPSGPLPEGVTAVDGCGLRTEMLDPGAELQALLEWIRVAGYQAEDVSIQAPSLNTAFLALTGRELRE